MEQDVGTGMDGKRLSHDVQGCFDGFLAGLH